MARKSDADHRYTIRTTQSGFVVIDNDQDQNMLVRGPYDGVTGKHIAEYWRDKLEREAEAKRARGAR